MDAVRFLKKVTRGCVFCDAGANGALPPMTSAGDSSGDHVDAFTPPLSLDDEPPTPTYEDSDNEDVPAPAPSGPIPAHVAAAYQEVQEDIDKKRLQQVDDLERALDFIHSQESARAAATVAAIADQPSAVSIAARAAPLAAHHPPRSTAVAAPMAAIGVTGAPPPEGPQAGPSVPKPGPPTAPATPPPVPEEQKKKKSIIIFRPDMPEPHEQRHADAGPLGSSAECQALSAASARFLCPQALGPCGLACA